MLKISCVINTYNEGESILKCLNSIKWVNEIVIVDMGSTDNTVNIANKFTNKIFETPYRGYVELARNYALSKAKNNWILVLDADEYLNDKIEGKIGKLIEKHYKIKGFYIPRRNYINKYQYLKYGYFYPDYQLRLFKNDPTIKYSGVIHEQVQMPHQETFKINDFEIYHNSSHSKYNSFFSYKRLITYIKIEGANLSKSKISLMNLFIDLIYIPIRHFWRSFIKLKGYKDGYAGFRAALIYAIYQKSVIFYSIKARILND